MHYGLQAKQMSLTNSIKKKLNSFKRSTLLKLNNVAVAFPSLPLSAAWGFWVPATSAVGLQLKIKSRKVRDVELEGKPNEIVALN